MGELNVGVIGSLAETDLVLAELLLRQGVSVTVFRSRADRPADLGLGFYKTLRREHLQVFDSTAGLLRGLRRCSFIYSITSGLHVALRQAAPAYPLLRRLGWPPYMVICSGSNIMERATERSLRGLIERASLRGAYCAMLNNYPVALDNARRLRSPNWVFLPFPYPVDPGACEASVVRPACEKGLRILHASRIDWGQRDRASDRRSTKGSDRFLRAFIRARKEGLSGHCEIVDRGSDRENARRLIQELGGEAYFVWRRELTRAELHALLRQCDLVVDQFDVGAFGGIAVEAMCCGTPVMAHVEASAFSLAFPGAIPVVTAETEEEIYRALWCCADGAYRRRQAAIGKEWVRQHYDPEALARRYLFYAEAATGEQL